MRVRTGDVVFGDVDGVVVLPQERAGEAIERALEKVTSETRTRDELKAGRLLGEVYATHGVL